MNGYWSPLLNLIEAIVAAGFAHPEVAELITVVKTPEQVLRALECAPPSREEVLTSHL